MENYERLEAIAKEYYGGVPGLAKSLGLTASALYYWKIRGMGFKQYKMLKDIGVNPDYIKNGIEPIFINETPSDNVIIPAEVGNLSAPMVGYVVPPKVQQLAVLDSIDLKDWTINEMITLKPKLESLLNTINEFLNVI